jgi:triphosphatase
MRGGGCGQRRAVRAAAAAFHQIGPAGCHHTVMKEVELKFQVPAESRKAVEAAVAGQRPTPRMHLQASYFDTPAAALADAGMALRLRKEGRRWVQTLKTALADGDGMARSEHNVPRTDAGVALPAVDPQLHAGVPEGALLLKHLKARRDRDGAALQRVMGTDIWRRARTVRATGGTVELAFDVGTIEGGPAAAPRRISVCELEIELKSGNPQAVLATAERWVRRYGLWLDTRSKAELGGLLARDLPMAEPCCAAAVQLSKSMTLAQSRHAVLQSCLEHISINASQIASGVHAPEHVHQLRIALRRLRTALRFFEERAVVAASAAADSPAVEVVAPVDHAAVHQALAHQALADDAAAVFRQLGAARDRAAVAEPLAKDLARALATVGMPADAPMLFALSQGAPGMANAQVQAGSAPQDTAPVGAGGDLPPALRDQLGARLNRWHRSAVADALAFDTLDDAGRHQLRKRIKRLRYAAEFAAGAFDAGAVRAYLKGLRRLQDRLGTVNDVAVGIALVSAAAPHDARALFALGWLAAQRLQALQDCQPELADFAKLPRFWRRPRRRDKSPSK